MNNGAEDSQNLNRRSCVVMEWGVGADVTMNTVHPKIKTADSESDGIELKLKDDVDSSTFRKQSSFTNSLSESLAHFPSLWKYIIALNRRTKIEIMGCCVFVVTVFAVSAYQFSLTKIESLVPFSSISSCDSAQEMFNLAQQEVEINYPGFAKLVEYHNGYTEVSSAITDFNGSWISCGGNTFNRSSFGLQRGHNTSYLPLLFNFTNTTGIDRVLVPLQYAASTTVTSTDGCFSLTCAFGYYYNFQHHNIEYYLDSRLLFIIPVTLNDAYDDKGNIFGNSQLMASISTTQSSVSANLRYRYRWSCLFHTNRVKHSYIYWYIFVHNIFDAFSGRQFSFKFVSYCIRSMQNLLCCQGVLPQKGSCSYVSMIEFLLGLMWIFVS
jgi:hypothetical protein